MSRYLSVFAVLQSAFAAVHHVEYPTVLESRQAASDDDLAKFGDTVSILGRMERTDQDWVDGLALDLFSPSNRTATVHQNFQPLAAQFVTGSTGEPFVAIANYSYVVTLNETANDLIAKIELPFDPVQLQVMGIDPANTYVGKLADDKKAWLVDEGRRNVHISENKTRIIKMTSLDGEYRLLGRRTADVANIFVQYGLGATRTVNFTGGPGVQEAEFVDGLRFTVQSNDPYTLNAELGFMPHVNNSTLRGKTLLNPYSWLVTTSMKNSNKQIAHVTFPINSAALQTYSKGGKAVRVVAARRGLRASRAAPFKVIDQNQVTKLLLHSGSVRVPVKTRLDGEYILLVDASPARTYGGCLAKGG